MLNSASRLLLLAFGLLFLFACGQRGPLYLPDNPPPNQGKGLCPTCDSVAEKPAQEKTEEKTDQAETDSPAQQADEDQASPQESSETTPNESNE